VVEEYVGGLVSYNVRAKPDGRPPRKSSPVKRQERKGTVHDSGLDKGTEVGLARVQKSGSRLRFWSK